MKVSAVILLALSVVASAANAADATNLPSEAPAVAELGTPSPTIPDRAPGVDPSFGLPDADSIKPGEQAEEDFSDYKPDMPFVGNALMKRQSAAFRTQFAPLYARFGARFQRFVLCVGVGLVAQCSQPILDCASRGTPPWQCAGAILCGGQTFRRCAQ